MIVSMLILFVAGCGAAYLARQRGHLSRPIAADLVIGLVAAFAGLSMAHYLGHGITLASLALPLLIACGLAIGLQSRPQPVV